MSKIDSDNMQSTSSNISEYVGKIEKDGNLFELCIELINICN